MQTNTQGITEAPSVTAEELKAKLLPFVGKGKALAVAIETARTQSDTVARAELLSVARELAGKADESKALLDGFAEELTARKLADGIVRTRKSEAKAVLDAWSKPAGDDVDGARKRMTEHAGGYHDFITLCREVRDGKPASERQGSNEKGKRERLNDKEVARSKELVASMSIAQATETAQAVAARTFSLKDGEIAAIRLMQSTYLHQLMQSKDKGIATYAAECSERWLTIVTAHDKAHQPAMETGKTVEDAGIEIPVEATGTHG